jgi:selenide,water dikinase
VFDESQWPDLLVGLTLADDAAAWRLSADQALVATVDFMTPVVDDPYDYGAIAAANALSDIYAMGATPFMALNLAALPHELPEEVLKNILRGGAEKVREAGAVVAGGHTIDDVEPKFGYAVLGMVRPDRIGRKSGAIAGDRILLTKPLGSGIITTAFKADLARPEHVAAAVEWMKRLNRGAAEALHSVGQPHAVTDVTGFGLLGHAWEIASQSRVQLRFQHRALPFYAGAEGYADDLLFPALANVNMADYGTQVTFVTRVEYERQLLLFTPETSGGLLVTLSAEDAARFAAAAGALGQPVWDIGEVVEGQASIQVD